MRERFLGNSEAVVAKVMQEYSVKNIADQLEAAAASGDELAMTLILNKASQLENVSPDNARTVVLLATSNALEAHAEYAEYLKSDSYDEQTADELRTTAKYYSLIAGEIGNEAPLITAVLPVSKKDRVSGEAFKAELGTMARDSYFDNPPNVQLSFYEDAFPDGIVEVPEENFPTLDLVKKRRKRLAVGVLATASLASSLQPAAAAPLPVDDILHRPSVDVSPSDINFAPASETIDVLPILKFNDMESSESTPITAPTVAESAPSEEVESPGSESAPSELPAFESVTPSEAPSDAATEAPVFPQESFVAAPAIVSAQTELPMLPKPDKEPKVTFIPAAPEKPPAEPEQGNKLKMNERQMEIEAADRVMERGGEWHNIGYGLKYLIDKGNMPPAVASAYVGNFLHEAPNMDPNTHQIGGGPGRGIAQWEGPGRFDHPTEGLLNYADNIVHRPWNDLETQLGFVVWETSNGLYETQMHQIVLDVYRETGSLARTSDAVVDWYERAGAKAYGERQAYSEKTALAFDEEYKKVERENNAGGVSVQSSNVVEIEPVSYVQKTAHEASPETIAGARVITGGSEWAAASYALWHLIGKSNVPPRVAIALTSNLTFNETSGKYDGSAMKLSRLYPELQAFARTNGRREEDLETHLDFIAHDLHANKPEINRYISALDKKNIGRMTTEVRDAYLKPYVNKDSERVAHATELQRLYNQQLKTVTA